MLPSAPIATAAATPPITPLEELADALDQVGPLHGLPFEDRMWLARHGQEFHASPGDVLFEEGAPAEHMVVLLRGEIHVRRQHGGASTLFIGRTAQLTGVLPFSRMKSYGGQGTAVSPVLALLIPASLFPEMLEAIPSMAQRVVSTLLDRVREVTRIEQQGEKLSALGKLAGNLAHELNNPASAAQRAAANLVISVRENRRNRFKLVNLCLSEDQIARIEAWETNILGRRMQADPQAQPQTHTGDAASLINAEEAIRAWMVAADGSAEAAHVAPPLAEEGVTAADLDEFCAIVGPHDAAVSLQFFARYLRSSRAADALVGATARISELIDAIKDYSNMDRAPIQEVDVPAGLDATLQMFGSRLNGVEVERAYEPGLPRISAYGAELNQAWSALIENALDAMAGENSTGQNSAGAGRLRLACRREGEMLLIEIEDSGPGIPREIVERIFEPFFTTKPPGHALGLGLDTATRIIRKHRGHIDVSSKLGCTCFRVRLPLVQFQAY